MSEENKVDTDWVKSQMTKARIRRGSGDAVLQLLALWETLELDDNLSKEAVETFSKVALGHSLVTENKDELWVPAQAGQLKVADRVRVKSDAFQGDLGRKFNGRSGSIVAIRTGRIVINSTDGAKPELDGEHFRAEQLELRIK